MFTGNVIIEGDTRNRTAEAIIASNTVSDRRVPKVKMIMITSLKNQQSKLKGIIFYNIPAAKKKNIL